MVKKSKIMIYNLLTLGFLAIQLLVSNGSTAAYERPVPYFKITLLAPTNNPQRVLHAQVATRELWKIGIDAELVLLGFDAALRRMSLNRDFGTFNSDGFDIIFIGWTAPLSVMDGLGAYHSSQIDKIRGGANYYPINSSVLDCLLDRIATELDPKQRRAYIQQALDILIWEHHPTTGIYQGVSVMAHDASLRSFIPAAGGIGFSWAEAYFEGDSPQEFIVATNTRFSSLNNAFARTAIDGLFINPTASSLYEEDANQIAQPVLAAADPIPLSSNETIASYIDLNTICDDSPYANANQNSTWGPNPNVNAVKHNAYMTAANFSMFLIPLRAGVPWQPGYGYTEDMKLNITADDLIWTWFYMLSDQLPGSSLARHFLEEPWGLDPTKTIEKLNETLVKLNFRGALENGIVADWRENINLIGVPLPRHVLDPAFNATAYGGAIGVTPDGTRIAPYNEQDRYYYNTGEGDRPLLSCGPYYLESWDESQQLAIYQKFANWGGQGNNSLWRHLRYQQSNIDTIGITIIPSKEQAIIALESGQIDVIGVRSDYELANDVQYLSNKPNICLKLQPTGGIQVLGYNTKHPRLSDRYVRLAISHLIPRQRIIDCILGGLGVMNEVVGLSTNSLYYPKEEEWINLGLNGSENEEDPDTGDLMEFQGHIRYSQEKAWALMEKARYDMTPFREAVRREEAGERAEQMLEPLPLLLVSGVAIAVVWAALVLGRHYWQQYQLARGPEVLRLSYQRKQLMDAIQLKQSPRLNEKAQAQELFRQVANAEVLSPDLTIYAMLNLCDMLLDEAKAYGEQKVFQEAESLSTRISNIAHEQESSSLQIEALLLRSKFALLRGEVTQADKLLEKSFIIAKGKHLPKMAKKVTQEQMALQKEVAQWEKLVTEAAPLRERLEYARLQDYIADAVRVIEESARLDVEEVSS